MTAIRVEWSTVEGPKDYGDRVDIAGSLNLVAQFGDTHFVDDAGEMYCNAGPATLIEGGRRILAGSFFKFCLGQQYDIGPCLRCGMCGQLIPIVGLARTLTGG